MRACRAGGDIPIQVNLVEEAQEQLAFLMDIEAVSDRLHQPHVIRNAIRRYETIWLPLVAEHRFEFVDLEPPLDVCGARKCSNLP